MRTNDSHKQTSYDVLEMILKIEVFAESRNIPQIEERFIARALTIDFDSEGESILQDEGGEIVLEKLYRVAEILAETAPSPHIEKKIEEEAERWGLNPTHH